MRLFFCFWGCCCGLRRAGWTSPAAAITERACTRGIYARGDVLFRLMRLLLVFSLGLGREFRYVVLGSGFVGTDACGRRLSPPALHPAHTRARAHIHTHTYAEAFPTLGDRRDNASSVFPLACVYIVVPCCLLSVSKKVASLLRENAGAKTEAGLRAGDLQQRLSAAQEELVREREAFAERKVRVGACFCARVCRWWTWAHMST